MFSDCLGGFWTGDEGLNVCFKHLYTNIALITVVRLCVQIIHCTQLSYSSLNDFIIEPITHFDPFIMRICSLIVSVK